jgi:hypothetical protein
MNLKSAAVELLLHTRETRFEDLKEVPTAYVENLKKALAEEVSEQKEVKEDA